ncbi:hypothetical protein RRG08_029660 [Elysia crispata]|uniref:Uncharacterized protein n=1 Tax=Elysia crispata TaxID=231223 RepID=A0AAE0XPF0_9GAST|nr:hypothetical protein RRG08_029660 [Elysia crispata]
MTSGHSFLKGPDKETKMLQKIMPLPGWPLLFCNEYTHARMVNTYLHFPRVQLSRVT